MVRLLNRAAYRYLVRGSRPIPTVEAPGPHVGATTDWAITTVGATDAIQLSDPAQPEMYLQIKEGEVFFGEQVPGPSNSALWQLTPVGDGSGYFYVVDAYFTGHGLALGERIDQDHVSFRTKIGPVGNNHEAMWFVATNECVRDARSIHLRYPVAADTGLFYNEVAPSDSPRGTYFCVTGFGGDSSAIPCPSGYAGIQRRADGSQIAIFSVWHRMLDAQTPDPDALAVTTESASNAKRTPFSGEGSGQSIRIPFAWNDGESSVRFTVIAEPNGGDTVLRAYVAKSDNAWIYMGTIRRINTDGHLLNGLYSFIEDFMRNGNEEGVAADRRSPYQVRRAVFSNPWATSAGRGLDPINAAKVTAYRPHPLENLSVTARSPGSDSFDLVVSTGMWSSIPSSVLGTTIRDFATSPRRRPVFPEGMQSAGT